MTEAPHGIPNVIFGFVDVRDVARAHIAAMEEEKAHVGRSRT
jgi:nucleoside-diphosphate-sugar epimerase